MGINFKRLDKLFTKLCTYMYLHYIIVLFIYLGPSTDTKDTPKVKYILL